ncbi:hypothetical protein [Spirulina sp. 06S082]|uniref:hypothetical protein n=1 Tax=Spirulina sp. 06S082 TaxID=3110248 RepID=UPI002B200100|nr:hypothetical protein [Spirulina sp. 06S082]MEA5470904.1 hypothetical protein [Spirulina sp. 06S082]
MQSQIVFILKIILLSGIISALIKYVAPYLAIAPTSLNAAIAILVPPIVLGSLLLWRDRNSS